MKRVVLMPALLISLILHGVLFVVLDHQRGWQHEPDPPSLDLVLQHVVPPPVEPTPAASATEPEQVREPMVSDARKLQSILQPQVRTQTHPQTHPQQPPAQPDVVPDIKLPDARELVMGLTDEENRTAFQAYVQPQCNAAEQSSLARICDPYSEYALQQSMSPVEESFLAAVFRKLAASNRDFNKDMNAVERLVAERATLSPLDPQDPLQVALVAEQRRELRDQIMRIDQKYAEANLLRLIPISRKVLQGLKEVSSPSR